MEIFARFKSFSFYHKSETLYITAEVINFVTEGDKADLDKGVEVGKSLSFKYSGNQIDQFITILKEPVAFITTNTKEAPRDPKYPEKFIIDKLRRCDIFKACS